MQATCTIDGCDRPHNARGLCHTHYKRWRRNGDPLTLYRGHGDIERSFWDRVDRCGDDECWPWLGSLTSLGYGRFYLPTGYIMAHRFAYELMVGPIPDGLHIDHVRAHGCTRKDCTNALRHLEPVTIRENLLRGDGASALNAKKTHCPAGHEYDEVNTYIIPNSGARMCRKCMSENNRGRRNGARKGI